MGSTRVVVLFNLKPGVSVAAYEQWARRSDLPTVNRLPSVQGFEIFKATGLLGSGAASPYAYIEVIDVADMDAFGHEVASAAMQRIAGEFQAFAESVFITTKALAWGGPEAGAA